MERFVYNLFILLFYIVVFIQDGCGVPTPQTHMKFKKSRVRSLKQAIGVNEDNYLTFLELATKYGFPSEKHKVVTADGYILTVFRVLPNCDGADKRYPVLLSHGMFDSADTWIINGPKAALGYILSTSCYDVWTTNRRGNSYSRKHIRLNPDKNHEFWNFSFDECGRYDLPAVIDYILNVTQKEKVNYVGHSQGTTDFFAMASLTPEYNEKVQISIHLAPVVFLRKLHSPLINIVAPSTMDIKQIFDTLGFRELFGRYELAHIAIELLCNFAPGQICGTSLFLTTGSRDLVSYNRLPIIFGHLLDGVSSKVVAHFGQIIISKDFQRYDEGKEGNLRRYGVSEPPKYNVSQITSPVVLIGSKNDWLSSLDDVNYLQSKLPHVVEKYFIPDALWSHNDHVWADNANKVLYPKVLEHLNKHNSEPNR